MFFRELCGIVFSVFVIVIGALPARRHHHFPRTHAMNTPQKVYCTRSVSLSQGRLCRRLFSFFAWKCLLTVYEMKFFFSCDHLSRHPFLIHFAFRWKSARVSGNVYFFIAI